MKGQKLFVRPLESDDSPAIEILHEEANEPVPVELSTATGLVGRLAGTTVAYLTWSRDGEAMVISQFFVASHLRGLRIGMLFLAEAVKAAASESASSLRVPQDCKLARYFERRGFVSQEGSLTMTIR